jgi:TM2 domain-containing membrane protein YozV
MTCANHPTAEAAAYCQQCGKPLCSECVRSVGGMIYCEPCLAARMGIPIPGQVPPPIPVTRPNPMLAGLLGFIPGVGAMYNGQLAKALAHVLIFAVFVSLAHSSSIFGILLVGWIFYQVFDAYHTAKARLYGHPLPNPFGLNDLGTRLGIPPVPPPHGFGGVAGEAVPPAPAADPGGPAPPYAPPSAYAAPVFSPAPATHGNGSTVPVGAVVLIVIGLFLLFQTLGILRADWIDRGWPLLIVGLGVWLLYRRTRNTPGGGS